MDYEVLVRLLLAALWGGIVGAEREYRSKSAGFRTLIMISMGACFFTIMSLSIGTGGNQDRIASNIVTGIGFIGAGVIFRGENRVSGITTAAAIWTVAAVGMGIGAGYYFASACASLLVVIVLAILPWLEDVIDKINRSMIYSVTFDPHDDILIQVQQLLKQNKLKYKISRQVKEAAIMTVTWSVSGAAEHHAVFISEIMKNERIKRFEC